MMGYDRAIPLTPLLEQFLIFSGIDVRFVVESAAENDRLDAVQWILQSATMRYTCRKEIYDSILNGALTAAWNLDRFLLLEYAIRDLNMFPDRSEFTLAASQGKLNVLKFLFQWRTRFGSGTVRAAYRSALDHNQTEVASFLSAELDQSKPSATCLSVYFFHGVDVSFSRDSGAGGASFRGSARR
jgi:hypothetical protein